MRPRLLDLFCGVGGAAVGYHRAGFEVVGVDTLPQPNYPFEHYQEGALGVLERMVSGIDWHLREDFDAIHASPPCQPFVTGGRVTRIVPDLLGATRLLLEQTGLPWVIENVPEAPMQPDVLLCGSMFGLPLRRHRLFEFSETHGVVLTPPHDHSQPIVGVYGHPHGKAGAWPGMLPSTIETWRGAMGIDWTEDAQELAEAIPPAYTEFIGEHVLGVLGREAKAVGVER